MSTSPPLPLGTRIHPYGTISAVSCRDGERYYMLTDASGRDVVLMPASTIEEMHRRQQYGDFVLATTP
ncbi:MAG: hypothetical protein KGL35_22875 [Bradyrhizobium sp.]|nr:hypothetical protein [Bradyrhizobium sp.]